MDVLLGAGADIDGVMFEETALEVAVSHGSTDAVKFLLSSGADWREAKKRLIGDSLTGWLDGRNEKGSLRTSREGYWFASSVVECLLVLEEWEMAHPK